MVHGNALLVFSYSLVHDVGFVAHEFIIDTRPFKYLSRGRIEADDIAKRLQDYGINDMVYPDLHVAIHFYRFPCPNCFIPS